MSGINLHLERPGFLSEPENRKFEIRIDTTIKPDGSITQELIQPDFNGVMRATTRWIMQTRDAQIRKALIDLGWTPPAPNSSKPSEAQP